MGNADIHMHTSFSHGRNTPEEMHRKASEEGFELIGFSEHSPRPAGFEYSNEYRDKLAAHWQDYIDQVTALKKSDNGSRTLLGVEVDWLDGQEEYIENILKTNDFDYAIGSVHFLDDWGFDENGQKWEAADQSQCDKWYEKYFRTWNKMLGSGLFNMAAHPDLVKIHSIDKFNIWLGNPDNQKLVRMCLKTLRDNGMVMEISAAGMRKPCHDFYPCPTIMAMAAEMHVPVTLVSDAHGVEEIGKNYAQLVNYAKAFGFKEHTIFANGKRSQLPICRVR